MSRPPTRIVSNWKFLKLLPQRSTHKCPARQMHLNPIEGPSINVGHNKRPSFRLNRQPVAARQFGFLLTAPTGAD
jgi:hypothetical protein